MRKTNLLVTVVLVTLSIFLFSSCVTRYSRAIGLGATYGIPFDQEGTGPVVDVTLSIMETVKNNDSDGKEGLLFVMTNTRYSSSSRTISWDYLFGPAFEINLNNPEIRLSLGVGPVLNVFGVKIDSFGPVLGPVRQLIFPGSGVAASLRFRKVGISGFISATFLGIGMGSTPKSLGIKGGFFVTAILDDVSL